MAAVDKLAGLFEPREYTLQCGAWIKVRPLTTEQVLLLQMRALHIQQWASVFRECLLDYRDLPLMHGAGTLTKGKGGELEERAMRHVLPDAVYEAIEQMLVDASLSEAERGNS